MKITSDENYYIGLDIGTNSVGYAVTDTGYVPLKYHGENMMGTHTFDSALSAAERRAFRTGRRSVTRKSQRVRLLQEIFSEEIGRIDKNFFIRLKESALYMEDKHPELVNANAVFNDDNYTDKNYHEEFPTIHHLICSLMEGNREHDIRLLYLACAWLVSHRGHFFSEVDKENVAGVLDFDTVYSTFEEHFAQNDIPMPWCGDKYKISEILKSKKNISAKEKELYTLLFNGKKPVADDEYPYDVKCIIKLLCGGETKAESLFKNEAYKETDKLRLAKSDEDLAIIFSELGDDSELVIALKAIYDWSVLSNVIDGYSSISAAKVGIYERHKKDLSDLKDLINKYAPQMYDDIFKNSTSSPNYVAYSGNFKWVKKDAALNKASKEDFLKYIKGIISKINVEHEDELLYNSILERIDSENFLPKQVDTNNRVIPYQLYYTELIQILDNAGKYLPFLSDKDSDSYTAREKIISVFEFRIPYFVGPLRTDNSKNAWMKRKAEGKIYPWNFEKMVDYDKSEQAFIDRMTNNCTYLPGETVLPKNSLLYSRYTVLNEINNIKINGNPIDVETKQEIYALFLKQRTVSKKAIIKYLISNAKIKDASELGGIDEKINSSLAPFHAFKRLIDGKILTENDVERIIERMAYTEEKSRLGKWLSLEYPQVSESDKKYICSLKLKGFGRLSKRLLSELKGASKETGELFTIMSALWETNENLMKLMSDNYTFATEIKKLSDEYYCENKRSLEDRLTDMAVPALVKRAVYRTLDVVKDITKLKGSPKKIFIEMSREFQSDKKGQRTTSRRDKITEFYKNFPRDEINRLMDELSGKTDSQLQSDRLYLYFMQRGKCMYTGDTITLDNLMSEAYDVDHIYPQRFVKDDSLTNRVLVKSEENGKKSDNYPIDSQIRAKMIPFWESILNKDVKEEKEKLFRLKRNTPFTDDERMGFINRQLVETRQSTKAIATLLKELYPETEIVYVKAGLVSEFRNEFKLMKSRSINDLHHAKDAYLNIVAGNVYHSYFTKFNRDFNLSNYTINVKSFFAHPKSTNGKILWRGQDDIALVRTVMDNNHIHYTNYSYCQKGSLYDVQPVKAGKNEGLIPRKKGLDPAKYGGYNKAKATYYTLVKYTYEKAKAKETVTETDIIFMPVELMYSERFEKDDAFAKAYAKKTIETITGNNVTSAEFMLNKRRIKIRTVLSLDGFCAFIRGKQGGGKYMLMSSMNSMYTDGETEKYIKHIDKFWGKLQKNKELKVDSRWDKITKEENLALYDVYCEKLSKKPFSIRFGSYRDTLMAKRELFTELSLEEQVKCLASIILLLKTGRAGTVDLSILGEGKSYGTFKESSSLSALASKYKDIRIVDISASGLRKKKSENLCDLL